MASLSVLLEEHDELIRSVRSYVSSSEVTVGIGKPSSTEATVTIFPRA